ncbi:hypothetical protein GmHk_20G057717 [Glycine max]|nr:hypothetical protein GmHk_20G057717 [Glycine max]
MQSQGLALPPEPLVGPSGPRVSTKGSCVDPLGNDPETGDLDRCGLYIEADPACLVALGRVYEGSTVVHNTPLLPGQVKAAVSSAKPPQKPDPKVDDPLYLMTLTIPELFLRLYQGRLRQDATVFEVFNPDFPLYIKHENLSEITHGGQCLSISVLQLWILFLKPQLIQRSGQSQFESESYIKSWMQRSKCDVYLRAYLNGGHWQMVVIDPNEHLVVWFCLDDAPQPKSKAPARWIVVKCNRQKGSTECGYYVMHWMSTIILGSFRNNWEVYFNDPRPLEPERLKVLRIQWAQYYLRVRDQT